MRCKACNALTDLGDYCDMCEAYIFDAELHPHVEEFAFDPDYFRKMDDWNNIEMED